MKNNNVVLSEKTKLTFAKLGNALLRLEEMLQEVPDAKRGAIDASIQRFEFCIELFWKSLKRLLADLGKQTTFPKEVLQHAYQGHLIDNEKEWLAMLDDRNLTSHTYEEELANTIYNNIKTYCPVMKKTYEALRVKYGF